MGVCCAEEGSAAPQQPVSTPAPPPVPSPPPTTQRPTTQRPTTTPRPVTAAPTPAATGRKGDDIDDLTTVVNSLYLRIDLLTFVLFPCRLVGRKPLFFYFGLFTRLHPQLELQFTRAHIILFFRKSIESFLLLQMNKVEEMCEKK